MRGIATWRRILRGMAAKGLRYSGVPSALRRARARGHASILLYHDPSPETFEAHLRHLAPRYRFIRLDALVDAIAKADWSQIPDRALVVTFDDGLRGNHALLPLFRRYDLVPTIYLCSQIVGTTRRFWFREKLDRHKLKVIPNAQRLDSLKRQTGFTQDRAYPEAERPALSRAEIGEMAPWVDFGAHTRFHPILTQCEDDEAYEEIAGSKEDLERLLGKEVRHFSFPNGDYLDREVEYAKRAGFASARTVDLGWARPDSDPYRLPIFGIADTATVDMLAGQLVGLASFVRRALRGRLDGSWRPNAPEA